MSAENTITLSKAQNWAEKWNTDKVSFLKNNDLKAFKILGSVINDVMSPSNVVDIRTYFGLDEENQPHLIIVGVDADGDDLINEDNGNYIYNFTMPCPNTCSNSLLKINH